MELKDALIAVSPAEFDAVCDGRADLEEVLNDEIGITASSVMRDRRDWSDDPRQTVLSGGRKATVFHHPDPDADDPEPLCDSAQCIDDWTPRQRRNINTKPCQRCGEILKFSDL